MFIARKEDERIVPIVPVMHLHLAPPPVLDQRPRMQLRLRQAWLAFVLWQQKREQRRALRDLTECQLKDVGLSRADIARETAKHVFWD